MECREDGAVPGVLSAVHGEPLLVHAVRGLLESGCPDLILVLVPAHARAACVAALHDVKYAEPPARTRVRVIAGGTSRTDSVRLFLRSGDLAEDDVVLVHDPARAFTPPGPVREVVAAIRAGAPAAVPVEPVTDTIKVIDADGVVTGTRDRAGLRCVQSPRGFRAATLLAGDAPADPLAWLGGRTHTVDGHPHGMRVVTEFDVTVAAAFAADTEKSPERSPGRSTVEGSP
ncbi:IspD/TarI family cytidylyltransferase [Amycolatopsis antarctica]|uniref:IspD/TarI family cytidylyltransferase n=1 Tax=Amycolatopsis antarctica TaxID=1854586 RepID=UPI0023E86475|nr:2-C-methyl-D-erythritol 4-phosphate cytidylyltransferase [Amycolatopsis antarctica]